MANKVFEASIEYGGSMYTGLPKKTNSFLDTYKDMLDEFTMDCKRLLNYVKRHGGIETYSIDKEFVKSTKNNYREYVLRFYISEVNCYGTHSITLRLEFYDEENDQ